MSSNTNTLTIKIRFPSYTMKKVTRWLENFVTKEPKFFAGYVWSLEEMSKNEGLQYRTIKELWQTAQDMMNDKEIEGDKFLGFCWVLMEAWYTRTPDLQAKLEDIHMKEAGFVPSPKAWYEVDEEDDGKATA